jgi:hypothetical protein
MSKVVDLQAFREKTLEQKSFGPWQKRFGEMFAANTRIADLPGEVILCLAQPGETSSNAFYELIMGALELGPAAKFFYLANDEQMRVVDVHLLLADQVRFEMMRRLGWLSAVPGAVIPLVDVIRQFDSVKQSLRRTPPSLDESYPGYSEYLALADGDKEVFIRRMLREAIEAFKKQIGD